MGEGLFAGRYELLGMLGHGGMARVQRARDTRMGRIVAVKTLLPELADNPDARRRFAREAQAAGALNHPGIVTVHDQDEVEDGDQVVPYLVMEFVSGRTLAQLVRERAPFEPEEAVRIVCDILDALAHAHSRGTVHRDVKPANVMITDEGTVKVADFGIARVLDSDQRLTATGSAIGTPSYMSPEQINGGDVDARSDVYAAGCVLVELLTGRPPFTDGNPINLMYWHVHTPPPEPSARNPRVPRELDALVLQALAKDPASRPADAAVFRNRLRGWLSGVAAAGSSAVPDPSADAAPAAAATSAPLVKDAAPAAPTAAPAADAPAHRADPRATYGLGGQLPVLPGAAPRQPAGAPGGPAPRTPGQFPPHIPAQGVRDATPPPPAQPQHPAYGQAAPHTPPSLTPPPPAYLPAPGTPPPNAGDGAAALRRRRGRWTAAGAGVAVAAVGVTMALVYGPLGGGTANPDPTGTATGTSTTVRNAALTLHGGKEGSGYGGGLDGVVRPSSTKGGTLRLAAAYPPLNLLDPAATYEQPAWNVQRLYLRKLVDYAPAPGQKGRVLEPDLATDTGKVSSDGLTWTFHLKSGVKFQDGSPITSQDVKYGIERTFARDVFPGGPSYFPDLLDEGQHYPGPYQDTDPDKLGLKSVATPDSSTIVFTLAKPFADFRYVLALSIGAPVPRSADTGGGKDFEKHPVASGPYKVASYAPDKSLELVRNPEWDPATDPIHSALPDRIDLTYLASQDAVEAALLDGRADLDIDAATLSDATETKILNSPALKANTDLAYSGATRFLSLQTDVAPFSDYQCRWAVEYAVDRASLRAGFGGQYDGGDIATTMLPPTSDGHDANATPFGTTAGVSYPQAAKTQLKNCGRPNGFDVTLAGPDSPQTDDAMQSVKTALAQVGIKVTVQSMDTATFYDALLNPAKLKTKKWGMVLTSWAADWPTGGGFLRTLIQPGSANNYSGLDDSEINSLVDEADAQSDPAKAADDWKKIDAKVMSESTMVPLLYPRHLVYRAPRLTNVYVQQVLGGIDLTALGVRR
jgi:peptide/nickel transport system substrate-binding protein